MLLSADDKTGLRGWIMRKLPEVSDSETEIFADYLLALLASGYEGDEKELRAICEEELPQFLNDGTTPGFINDLFRVIETKDWTGTRPAAQTPARSGFPNNSQPPAGPKFSPNGSTPFALPAEGRRENRKRPFNDGEEFDFPTAPPRGPSNGRHIKQPRRSGGLPPRPSWPQPAFLPDQNGMTPGYGPVPHMPSHFPQPVRSGYIHSGPVGFPQGQYEPSPNDLAAAMLTQNMQQMQQLWDVVTANGNRGGHGRGRGAKRGGGRRATDRAPFSAGRAVTDRTKSTIVVESIPEPQLTEEAVRNAFSEFGAIVEVTLQLYHRLAIVKYDSWHAANAAYQSTKAFFDNRFVKVFWYNDDAGEHGNGVSKNSISNAPEEPEFDLDAFIKKQDEAQKAYEEKRERQQELEKQRQDLTERQRDLMERQREIRQKLQEKLGKTSGEDGADGSNNNEVLRAQLAALEEEAKYLGLDPDAEDAGAYGGFRGGYRGRGRGRGRGGYRGRGGHAVDRAAVYAAFEQYTLDNRTRVVAVSGVDFSDSEKDEALRQHLFGIGEFSEIQITPTTAQITFKTRKTAERFVQAAKMGPIPSVGSVEVAWVENGQRTATAAAAPPSVSVPLADPAEKDEPEMAAVGKRETAEEESLVKREPKTDVDMDYEVYEDGEWVD
ncbi:hypothetical protein ACHAQH_002686 [Verticillium albo-atrum]